MLLIPYFMFSWTHDLGLPEVESLPQYGSRLIRTSGCTGTQWPRTSCSSVMRMPVPSRIHRLTSFGFQSGGATENILAFIAHCFLPAPHSTRRYTVPLSAPGTPLSCSGLALCECSTLALSKPGLLDGDTPFTSMRPQFRTSLAAS
jgi:hypothetical protein